jgi:hypothetical protein
VEWAKTGAAFAVEKLGGFAMLAIVSSILKNRWFSLPRRVDVEFFGFHAGICVHATLGGGEGAASYVPPKTATQVCQLFFESHRS